jgi:FlaA1/EpsC-like NDP-sugar epimerase
LPLFDKPIVSRRIFHVLVDLVFVLNAYLGALFIAADGVFTPELRSEFLQGAPVVGFVQIASFVASGLYERSYRYTGIADFTAILRGLVAATVIPFFALRLLTGAWPRAAVWVLDGYLLTTLAVGVRISFRLLEFFSEKRRTGRRILLWGAGKGGLAALREIRDNHDLGMRPIAFLDDAPKKRGVVAAGLSVYGPADLEHLIHDRLFDELVVATAKIPPQRLRWVAERCAMAGIPVRRLSIGWEELEAARPSREPPEVSAAEG